MASPYREYTIAPEIINVLRRYVFDYSFEICANFKKTEQNVLIPHNILKGSIEEYAPGKFRGTCNHREYSSNMFHSHPVSSYAYPSTEDVIKVVKNYGKIVNSFIATKWGIWVISNTTSSNIYTVSGDVKLRSWIDVYLSRIGTETKTSEEERKTNPDKSRDLNSEDFSFISKTIKKISSGLNIKIELYTWNDIINKGIVVNGLTD